jgi:hypothetical protein
MRAERALLRTGEYLVGRACRHLPRKLRDQRYREWTAELPAILHDPQISLAPRRAVRMLAYAADTLRASALTPGPARRRAATLTAVLVPLFVADLVGSSWSIWDTAQAPGNWVNYLQVAWSLFLAAWTVSFYFRSTARMTSMIFISGCLVGAAVCIENAVQAPGDWVNYLLAAQQFVMVLLICWLIRRGPARRHNAGPPGMRTAS